MFSIRPVDISDAKELNRLKRMRGVFENTINNSAETVEMTARWIEKRDNLTSFFVAELSNDECNGKTIVGYVMLEIDSNPRLSHVANLRIAVDTNYQNKKIGSALLDFIIDYGDNWLPINKIELTGVSGSKTVSWYEKRGFEIEGKKRRALLLNGKYVDLTLLGRFKKKEIKT